MNPVDVLDPVIYRPAGLRPVPIAAFTSPATRMLLAGDGSTTLLLQAVTRGPVTVRVLCLTTERAADLPPGLRALLELDDHSTVLTRRSVLLDETHRPISSNHVVSPADDDTLRLLAADPTRPIGLGLIGEGLDHTRRPQATGLAHWDDDHSAAASKAYLISRGRVPRMFLWERFDPARFDPATIPSPG
jgi:chorismate-pyruvate lyase